MKPLSDLPTEVRDAIICFLCDIDDTMTDSGKLPAQSYDALWRLSEAGMRVVPVTGRPAGWCDMICRQWPVDAVIGENGAFYMHMDAGHLRTVFHSHAPDPPRTKELRRIADEVFAEIPGTRWAKDQFARLFDVAIDFREEPPLLDFKTASQIQRIFEAHGAQAKVSSIHVNAWFGEYDKVSMASECLNTLFGLDINDPEQNATAIFVGDSPNDEPMFARFATSVAVANISSFAHTLSSLPGYVTSARSATGFVQLVNHVLADRR